MAANLMRNTVILSALAGVAASVYRLAIPVTIHRFLDILSGLAPPTSLLLIGASLSISQMRKNLTSVLGSIFIKIVALPLVGLTLLKFVEVDASDYLPALILLAAPTATVAYVMAREMQADDEFAVGAISASTIFSTVTDLTWLTAVGGG